jgi:hypothetical protein
LSELVDPARCADRILPAALKHRSDRADVAGKARFTLQGDNLIKVAMMLPPHKGINHFIHFIVFRHGDLCRLSALPQLGFALPTNLCIRIKSTRWRSGHTVGATNSATSSHFVWCGCAAVPSLPVAKSALVMGSRAIAANHIGIISSQFGSVQMKLGSSDSLVLVANNKVLACRMTLVRGRAHL